MSDHEELEAMVAPWVLGALEPAEADEVRTHAEGCAGCREIAERLRRVVGALPLAVDEVTPPARLRSRVLAAAMAARSETVVGVPRARLAPRAPRRIERSRIPAFALAAVALIALLVGVLIGQVALRPAQQTEAARYTLSGHAEMAGSRGTVVDLRSQGVALVNFAGLPAPGEGRVYEVWLIPSTGSPVGAAVFVPDANGSKTVLIDRSLAGYTQMAVTNEAGPDGAAAPTQQPQLYGSLA